jgi:hypothetical protein
LYTNVLGQTQYFEEFWTISNNEADIDYNFERKITYVTSQANNKLNLLTEPSKIITGCTSDGRHIYVIHVTSTDVLRANVQKI